LNEHPAAQILLQNNCGVPASELLYHCDIAITNLHDRKLIACADDDSASQIAIALLIESELVLAPNDICGDSVVQPVLEQPTWGERRGVRRSQCYRCIAGEAPAANPDPVIIAAGDSRRSGVARVALRNLKEVCITGLEDASNIIVAALFDYQLVVGAELTCSRDITVATGRMSIPVVEPSLKQRRFVCGCVPRRFAG